MTDSEVGQLMFSGSSITDFLVIIYKLPLAGCKNPPLKPLLVVLDGDSMTAGMLYLIF